MDTVEVIARAMRKAKPMTAPGTYRAEQAQAVRGQYVGWRYAVTKMADTLQAEHGALFDRQAFNRACGTND